MWSLKKLRFLINLSNICLKTSSNVTSIRYLRGLPSRKAEFKALSNPDEESSLSEVEKAQKELAALTGGMDMKQIKQLLRPSKKQGTLNISKDGPNTSLEAAEDTQKLSLPPTYNLAAYVDKSPLLQDFLKLGVDLSAIERRKGLTKFVLNLHTEKDVQPHLLFLRDQGVPSECLGEFITKNPLIFKIDLDDMQTRVNYLEAKQFSPAQIQRIISSNPFWLMFSTKRIDNRLGYFQKEFGLKGDDVRFLTSKQPRLITYKMDKIQKATFCIREEMGFNEEETRCLLLSKPKLWMMNSDELIERFAFVHKEMQLPHQMILQQPEILCCREFRLRERHEFLRMLGRAQYDPEKDMYIAPKSIVEGNNHYFVRSVAKCDMETFDLFLRTR